MTTGTTDAPPAAPARRYTRPFRSHRLQKILRRRWPDLFTDPVPLAIGIREQIDAALTPEENRRHLGPHLGWWTGQGGYHAAVASGAPRRNLDGTETGPASLAHQEHAVRALGKVVVHA